MRRKKKKKDSKNNNNKREMGIQSFVLRLTAPDCLGLSFYKHWPSLAAQAAQFTSPRPSRADGHLHLLSAEWVVELAPHTLDPHQETQLCHELP